MAQSYRTVRFFSRKKKGNRFSHNVRPSDNNSVFSARLNSCFFKQYDNSVRRTRKIRFFSYNKISYIHRMKAVYVF